MNTTITRRLHGNEQNYVQQVLDSEFRGSKSAGMTARLEAAFAQRFGSKYAISFVNGTATMHAALEARGIGPGDEVIVPPLTMSATTFAILQANATPVYADVHEDTFQISASAIEACITEKTRAIITVSLFGLSPDMDAIMAIANKHGLFVIEDNAECFLGRYKGRMVGTLGHCSSFSFQSSKHITSGEGGMVLTDDYELADRIRKVQCLGYASVGATKSSVTKRDIQDPDYFRHVTMGWNYRMPELCSAVALAQLENIDLLVSRRIEAAQAFTEAAQGCDWLTAQHIPEGLEHSYWTWVVVLKRDDISWRQFRDRFISFGGDGIYAAWQLSYLEPMFQKQSLLGREKFIDQKILDGYRHGLCPVAERLQPRLLQFKNSYWDPADAQRQAQALHKTIASF